MNTVLRSAVLFIYASAAFIVINPGKWVELVSALFYRSGGSGWETGMNQLGLFFVIAWVWSALTVALGIVYLFRKRHGKSIPWWPLVALANIPAVLIGIVSLIGFS